jgi:hypothetical protein
MFGKFWRKFWWGRWEGAFFKNISQNNGGSWYLKKNIFQNNGGSWYLKIFSKIMEAPGILKKCFPK